MNDCIFCKIVRGEAPAHKIWEDEEHLAFLSIYPNTPGFSVVIPKVHHPSYAFELADEVLSKLTIAAKRVGCLLDSKLAGVARTGLLEAWDFTTASDESLTTDMVTIRDEAIRLNDVAGNCRITVTSIEESPDANVYRRMEGTIRVALFLNGTDPGGTTIESIQEARIHRDAMGRPTQNPDVPFAEVRTATLTTGGVQAQVFIGLMVIGSTR